MSDESVDNLTKYFYEKMKKEFNSINRDINLKDKYNDKSESDQD